MCSSALYSCGILHCTQMNPINVCRPAQLTAQWHEDVYGILHPALPCLIPLSDSFLNGINKLSRPASCLHFSSQRNKHSVSNYKGPRVKSSVCLKHFINCKILTVQCKPVNCLLSYTAKGRVYMMSIKHLV